MQSAPGKKADKMVKARGEVSGELARAALQGGGAQEGLATRAQQPTEGQMEKGDRYSGNTGEGAENGERTRGEGGQGQARGEPLEQLGAGQGTSEVTTGEKGRVREERLAELQAETRTRPAEGGRRDPQNLHPQSEGV